MVATVGAYILTTVGATTLAASAAATFAVGYLATTALTNVVLGALSPKPSVAGTNRGYMTNVIGSAMDHQIIYGKVRVGVFAYMMMPQVQPTFIYTVL